MKLRVKLEKKVNSKEKKKKKRKDAFGGENGTR